MVEIQHRHISAASAWAKMLLIERPLRDSVTVAERRAYAQALADREAAFVAWLKDGAPRPGLGDEGCYEECMDDTLDNMVAAVESGRDIAPSAEVTETSGLATTEEGSLP